jgi:type I restriction enzyme R subunit
LIRLEKHLDRSQQAEIGEHTGGKNLAEIARGLLEAVDPDKILEHSSVTYIPEEKAALELAEQACRPLAADPELRVKLADWQRRSEQVVDEATADVLVDAGFDAGATESARRTVESFKKFVEEHRDEITALQIIYSIPRGSSRPALTFDELRKLAEHLQIDLHQADPLYLTETLWNAYRRLERGRVRGSGPRVLADLVSLVRHVALDEDIEPYPSLVQRRYKEWLATQEAGGRTFTPEQRWWLDQVAAHIGINLEMTAEDFTGGAFFQKGGQVAALRAFGGELMPVVDELNEALGGR